MPKGKPIPDLNYVIARFRGHFCPAAYVVAFYRHDSDGNAYCDDFRTYFGEDGRIVRRDALASAKAICHGTMSRGYRSCYAPHGSAAVLLKSGCPDRVENPHSVSGAYLSLSGNRYLHSIEVA